MTIKLFIKNISRSLGFEKAATKVWFHYLASKNNVSIKYFDQYIDVYRSAKVIRIPKSSSEFGSLGIVVRDFNDFFKTLYPEKQNELEIIDFSTPKFHKLLDSNEEFYFHDICEPATVTQIYIDKSNAKEGDVIFDIGGYCGTQTVYFSRLVGESGKVFVFEPDSKSYNSLCINLEKHKCKNVIALKLGIYSKDGEIGFDANGGMGASINEKGNSNSIKVRTLQSIQKEYNLSKVDFIKMDIEGSELEVLDSSSEFITKNKPRFIIEPHFLDGVLNDKSILSIFENIKYQSEILKQGEFDYQPLIYSYPKN